MDAPDAAVLRPSLARRGPRRRAGAPARGARADRYASIRPRGGPATCSPGSRCRSSWRCRQHADRTEGIQAPVVSAGPYFVREWTKNRRIVLGATRTTGDRVRAASRGSTSTIGYSAGDDQAQDRPRRDRRGATSRRSPTPSSAGGTAPRHNRPAATSSAHSPTILYLAMNHDRPLFGGPRARERAAQAGNQPRHRPPASSASAPAYGAHVHDQLLPPTIRGFADVPDLPPPAGARAARSLARAEPTERGTACSTAEPARPSRRCARSSTRT